jgi:hypothetical protein
MIWPLLRPPDLRRSAPEPQPIQLGRPYSLYLGRESADVHFTTEWATFAEIPGGPTPRVVLPLPAEVDDLGVAVVRVPKEAWRGRLVLFGRFEDGNVTRPIHFDLKEGGRPQVRAARPAETLPLRVMAFAPDGAPADDGPPPRVVRVEVVDLPLPVTFDAMVKGGVAAFGGIPFLERSLRVASDAFGGEFAIDPDTWLSSQELRVTLPGPEERVLHVPGAPQDLEVQVRAAGGASYGLLPYRRSGDALTLRLAPGDVRVLLRAGDRWAATRTPEGAGEWRVPFADFPKATHVRLALRGGGPGQVRLHRIEDETEVLGQGLTRSVRGAGDLVAIVPAGSYRLERFDARGTSRHPATHAMAPGGQMRIPLD